MSKEDETDELWEEKIEKEIAYVKAHIKDLLDTQAKTLEAIERQQETMKRIIIVLERLGKQIEESF
mgnify:CR=1 FL=1